jgi:hypothetical protein
MFELISFLYNFYFLFSLFLIEAYIKLFYMYLIFEDIILIHLKNNYVLYR